MRPSYALGSLTRAYAPYRPARRCYSGCARQPDQEQRELLAAIYWDAIIHPGQPITAYHIPRNVLARAYSCMGELDFTYRLCMPPGADTDPNRPADISDEHPTPNIDAVYSAALNVNQCARLGLTTAEVLEVGRFIEKYNWRDNAPPNWTKMALSKEDNPDYKDPKRFAVLKYLWAACDKYNGKSGDAQQAGCSSDAVNTRVHRCAAPGCGMEETEEYKLQRCSGPCSEEHKPRYCDHTCQRRVSSDFPLENAHS